MALIKTIAEVKKYIRISNFNQDTSLPDMDAAAVEHLIPYCGQAIYDEIEVAYNTATLTTDQQALLEKMQRALAAWGYHDSLAFINATITDRGITYTQTAEMPPVSRWAFNKLKSALKDKALAATERMLEYLEQNKTTFPSWENSGARTNYKKLLIRSGYEFSTLYNLYQPLRTFIALKSIMEMVEEMYIESAIGKDFFQSLKDLTAPSDEEKTLIGYLKKAVAYRTIWHAIQDLPVRISDNGFTVMGSGAPDGLEPGRTADNSDLLGMKLKAAAREGDHYLVRARDFLNQKAAPTVFSGYYNSNYYINPNEQSCEQDKGNDRRHFFRL